MSRKEFFVKDKGNLEIVLTFIENAFVMRTQMPIANLPDPEAGWRLLAHMRKPWMLRREGEALVAYLDFSDWIEASACESKHKLAFLFEKHSPLGLSFSGWVGFWTYDFLAAHMGLQLKAKRDFDFPDMLFGRPTTLVKIYPNRTEIETLDSTRLDGLTALSSKEISKAPAKLSVDFQCNLEFNTYRDLFHAAREEILNGNTYQIKLSQRYCAQGHLDALNTFRALDEINPSPEAFVVKTPTATLVSCSPETVIDKRGSRIETRPIGGTWERSNSNHLADFTRNDKELCEHNMLVDLERNDLSRICSTGSVEVSRFREVEAYAHLYHLVSTIRGEVREGVRCEDIIRAMLPGGSIAGCPKWRTMELIDRFEPTFRGAYTGSFGTVSDNGDMRMNLIIRTLVGAGGSIYAQAGGGIVVDSTPEYEFRENALKARALLEVLK